MVFTLVPTLYDHLLSDAVPPNTPLLWEEAEKFFNFLQTATLFNWHKTHNFCEARAEAAAILLHAANIPHAKAWVFGASMLRKNHVGGLINHWNYHVAIAFWVQRNHQNNWYVADPSLQPELLLLNDWAASVTDFPHSYHCIKKSSYYIFPSANILQKKWHHRDHQNFKWTLQGLAGINGLTSKGKAQLVFKKAKIRDTRKRFRALTQQFIELNTVIEKT